MKQKNLLILVVIIILFLFPAQGFTADCECQLIPDNTHIPLGATLGFKIIVTNNTAQTQVFGFGTKVKLPNGTIYPPSDYLLGPSSVSLDSEETRSEHISLSVSSYFPLGQYTYYGVLGQRAEDIWCQGQFTFQVVDKVGVPKTGQTTCYEVRGGEEIPCSNTNQDGDLQKGTPWPNPRFIDNGDGTVTDNLTGLMWLRNANCISTNYPGFDNDAPLADGLVTWEHAFNFVVGINYGLYSSCGGGYRDWRLPNINELESLRHRGFDNPAVPDTAGTGHWSDGDPFTYVQSFGYWSTTTGASSTGVVWCVDMYNGKSNLSYKLNCNGVWPVRGRE